MEPDCLEEREELIKLVQKYKLLMNRIVKDKNIDTQNNEIIINLKKEYEEIQSKLIDSNLFIKYLGDDFESECKNIDNMNEDEEDKKDIEIKENDNDNLEEIDEKNDEEKDEKEMTNKEMVKDLECENDENKNENLCINKIE